MVGGCRRCCAQPSLSEDHQASGQTSPSLPRLRVDTSRCRTGRRLSLRLGFALPCPGAALRWVARLRRRLVAPLCCRRGERANPEHRIRRPVCRRGRRAGGHRGVWLRVSPQGSQVTRNINHYNHLLETRPDGIAGTITPGPACTTGTVHGKVRPMVASGSPASARLALPDSSCDQMAGLNQPSGWHRGAPGRRGDGSFSDLAPRRRPPRRIAASQPA
jgi:hypothetical protein